MFRICVPASALLVFTSSTLAQISYVSQSGSVSADGPNGCVQTQTVPPSGSWAINVSCSFNLRGGVASSTGTLTPTSIVLRTAKDPGPVGGFTASSLAQVTFDLAAPIRAEVFGGTDYPSSYPMLEGPGIQLTMGFAWSGVLLPGRYTLTSFPGAPFGSTGSATLIVYPFSVEWSTQDCGGGSLSGGEFDLVGTIGQYDSSPFGGSVPYSSAILASAPAAYWRLNESTGTTAVSQIGAPANNATYGGTFALAQPGAFASDTAASISHGSLRTSSAAGEALFSGRTTLAVECWIKPISSPGYVFYLQYGDDSRSRLSLEGDPVNPTMWLNNSTAVGTVSLPLGQYTHLVLQIDGTNAKIYRNGVQVVSTPFAAPISPAGAGLHAFTLGAGRGATQFFANAAFDEVAIYPRALSDAEVHDHYQAALSDSPQTEYRVIGGYWARDVGVPPCLADFDDGSGMGQPDGGVTIDDLLYYIELFRSGSASADIDDGSFTGTPDGGVTIDDLLYYLARYSDGC